MKLYSAPAVHMETKGFEASGPPIVTAMMPAYNEEAGIGAAIESILAQTYPHWELVVVDDGSTDATASIVQSFADPRIRYVYQPNQGRGAARNRALLEARGEFIAITDADDISLPHRFASEVAFFDAHPAVGVVSGQVLHFSETLSPTALLRYPVGVDAVSARFDHHAMGIAHAAAMIRRSVFEQAGNYSVACKRAQDLEFMLRARHTTRIDGLDDVLVHYRQDPRMLTPYTWVRMTLYHHYAVYRYQQWQAGARPLSFGTWSKQPLLWAKLLTWDLVRYVRYQVIVRRRLANDAPAHVLR